MSMKLLMVLGVFCFIQTNGNMIITEETGEVSKRGKADLIVPLAELGVDVLEKALNALGDVERTVAVGIGNDTPYTWKATGVYFRSGTSDEFIPAYVDSKEAVVYPARKTSGPVATGAVGVLCYYIPDQAKSLCVVFSVPFDYNLYSNWWDVKLLSGSVSPSQQLYEDMYYGNPYKGSDSYHDKDLGYGFKMVDGAMTSGGNAQLIMNIQKN